MSTSDRQITMAEFNAAKKTKGVESYTRKLSKEVAAHDIKQRYFKHCPELYVEFSDCMNVLSQIIKEAGHKDLIVKIR